MYSKDPVPGAVGLSPGETAWNTTMLNFSQEAEAEAQEVIRKRATEMRNQPQPDKEKK